MKVRTLKSAGIDIIGKKRAGACTRDITGKRYIDCQTGSGIMNVGRRNPEIAAALKQALDAYDMGVFPLCSRREARGDRAGRRSQGSHLRRGGG
ncbi:MAG TPA: hypothetical protein VLM75_01620 [Spirochaetota bacterium]|nr:hypothetical protein [Spirochaetota bacterium]